jgi:disulfide bond formation protein DsbB
MSSFFAALAFVALGIAAVLGVLLVANRRSAVLGEVAVLAPWLAAAVAATAMAGSLYYSESAGFVPCELCWYQRIAMYPLVPLLAIAAIRRELLTIYVVVIAGIGALISIYHYQLQLFPDQASTCSLDVPCTTQYVDVLGFVSIPFMAGCGFLAIIALALTAHSGGPSDEHTIT